jgi:acetyl esterase/lipase
VNGYWYPDTVNQVGAFTQFLEANRGEYNANMSRVYFAGRSLGGTMAMSCAYGYNKPFIAGNFSSTMHVAGVLSYYAALDIGIDSNLIGYLLKVPFIEGSNQPGSAEYNPQWLYYNPRAMADPAYTPVGDLPPTFLVHGTHDWVPPGNAYGFAADLRALGHTQIVVALFPLASHGFDAIQWSHTGQVLLYYVSRFFALCPLCPLSPSFL